MKTILTTPIAAADIASLRVGDAFYVTGRIVTGRDDVHHRVARENIPSPIDLRGLVMFHAGPIVRTTGNTHELISIGPTSSVRMNADQGEFIRRTGVRVILGKGGMNDETAAACREFGAVHCVYPGGCAVLGASMVEEVEGVYWPELGMPECMWVLRVREFGPLIVSIDAQGNNMFSENKKYIAARRPACEAPIISSVAEYMHVEAK